MPSSTNSDRILELKESVADLSRQIEHANESIRHIDIGSVRERLMGLETQLERLEQDRRERLGRASLLVSGLVSAVIGAIAGALSTSFLRVSFF